MLTEVLALTGECTLTGAENITNILLYMIAVTDEQFWLLSLDVDEGMNIFSLIFSVI